MNLNLIQPKNEVKDLLLSKSKNCEVLIEQAQKEAEETLEFKLTKTRDIYHFKPSIPIEGSWMRGLLGLEV